MLAGGAIALGLVLSGGPAVPAGCAVVPADHPAGPGAGRPIWSDGLETGSFARMLPAPWDVEGADPPQITSDCVRSGHYAEEFTMPGGGLRAEQTPMSAATHAGVDFHAGDDLYFGFSVLLDPGWPRGPNWDVITQWHLDAPRAGSVIVGLDTDGGRFQLFRQDVYGGGVFWRHPLIAGRWVDYVVHIKFSSDPRVGFVELWQDGLPQRLSDGRTRLSTSTWYPGARSGWWKHGIYRDPAIARPGRLWFDDLRIARTYGGAAP